MLKIARAGLSLLALAGCTNSAITTNKAADVKEPKRLVVIQSMAPTLKPAHATTFREIFAQDLTRCGIAQEFVVRPVETDTLQLESEPAKAEYDQAKINALRPDSVLTIREGTYLRSKEGTVYNVVYQLSLAELPSKKVTWRARIQFVPFSGLMSPEETGEKLAHDLTGRLKEDGIFHGCP